MADKGWGSEWPNGSGWPSSIPPWPKAIAVDLAIGEMTVLTTFEHDGLKYKKIDQSELKPDELKSEGSNLVDTQGYLYLQCEKCSTLLNPHTKSFHALQERRVNSGWKCVWNANGLGYKVYCEECKV